jgi:hypothetical protein
LPAQPVLDILWDNNALDLLDGRDRYTRDAIREEFGLNPHKGAITLDPVKKSYLTPVSDRKFSVVWRVNQEGAAVVRAVVPLGNVNLDADAFTEPEAVARLREYVERVVRKESKNKIVL